MMHDVRDADVASSDKILAVILKALHCETLGDIARLLESK
jgi:hypothetical protein